MVFSLAFAAVVTVGALLQGTAATIAPSPGLTATLTKSPWTQGTYINCGGPAFNGTSDEWQADAYISSGTSFAAVQSSSFSNRATADAAIFESLRFFGGQSGSDNTYSIPVSSPGYCFVRLYFAEILYTSTTPRRFSVSIEGAPVLTDFEVPRIQEGVLKEFFVPVTDGIADITFHRGAVGDPMISAIALTPCPSGMYGLNLTSGIALGTEYRIAAGLSTKASVVDMAGRVWTSDDATPSIYSPLNGTTLPTLPVWNMTKAIILGFSTSANSGLGYLSLCDTVPELEPAQVLLSARTTINDKVLDGQQPQNSSSLNYTLTTAPSTPYMLRLSMGFFGGAFNGSYIFNLTVDGVPLLSNVDLFSIISSTSLFLPNLFFTTSASGFTLLSLTPVIGPHSVHAGVWAQGIELFRVQQVGVETGAALPPSISPTLSPASTTNQLWMGLGFGIAIGVTSVCLLLCCLALAPTCLRRWSVVHDLETGECGKEGQKLALKDSGAFNYLLGKPAKSTHDFSAENKEKSMTLSLSRTPLYGTQAIPLADLQVATNNFAENNILGHGGFGVVYRAVLPGGLTVAVKRLDLRSSQGEKEFLMEVELLSRLHHRHLVNLLGFCDEEEQLMLVYEFVPNGTLREQLRDEEAARAFCWSSRVRVALGAARGIEYLHRGALPSVIHRDIKTSNILLDFNLDAKVADFGLSKLGRMNGVDGAVSHISTHVKGTLGYLDPSYYTKQQLTEKSDVYSFGVVLLELLTGRMPIWQEVGEGAEGERLVNLVDWSAPFLKGGNVSPIAALQLDVGPSLPSMEVVARMARMCVETQSKLRPVMGEVVRELEEAKRLLEVAHPTPLPTLESLESSFVKEKAPTGPKEGHFLSVSFISET